MPCIWIDVFNKAKAAGTDTARRRSEIIVDVITELRIYLGKCLCDRASA